MLSEDGHHAVYLQKRYGMSLSTDDNAVCCNVLQCDAMYCSVLRCMLQYMLQRVAVCRSVLRMADVCGCVNRSLSANELLVIELFCVLQYLLQYVAVCCSVDGVSLQVLFCKWATHDTVASFAPKDLPRQGITRIFTALYRFTSHIHESHHVWE